MFIKNYGEIKFLFDRESILETCFLDDYLFPDKEQMPLPIDREVNEELLNNYKDSFIEWIAEICQNHIDTQELIKSGFDH